MKLIYCLLLLLCPYSNIASPFNQPLAVGDAMPDVVCNNVLNYSKQTIDFAALKGRLTIIDFILTTCGSCLHKLTLFDSLQKVYGDNVQFIMVTSQPKETVRKFLQKNPVGKQLRFPVISNDTKLAALFPHEWFSHLVWIAPGGIVKAITDGDYVTAGNIRQVLDGESINWSVKRDVADFDYSHAFMSVNAQVKGIQPLAPLSSSFMPYLPDVGQYHVLWQEDSVSHTARTAFYNQPIIEMYLRLQGKYWFPRSQIILHVKDSSRYIFDEHNYFLRQWMEQNTFCYESILPAGMSRVAQQQRIINELNFYFDITVRLEEKEIPCLILRQTSTSLPPIIDSATESISNMVYDINQRWSGMPVFVDKEETGQIRLPVSKTLLKDINTLKELLRNYGYELVPGKRKVEMLVITEPDFITNQTN